MKPIYSRTLKAFCAIAVVAMLFACGSSKTVDPLVPTRVIGLGDAYNDTSANQYTVHGTGEVSTVVGQVAALFGNGATVISYASSTYAPGGLFAQASQVQSLQDSDLIVISAGTTEFLGNRSALTYLDDLKATLDLLKTKGAKHILINAVLDMSQTGYGYGDPVNFNGVISGNLGSYSDVARFVNIPRVVIGQPGWPFTSYSAYCGVAITALTPCNGTTDGASDVDFFADTLYPTPAGIRWIAQNSYNSTGQGWR